MALPPISFSPLMCVWKDSGARREVQVQGGTAQVLQPQVSWESAPLWSPLDLLGLSQNLPRRLQSDLWSLSPGEQMWEGAPLTTLWTHREPWGVLQT